MEVKHEIAVFFVHLRNLARIPTAADEFRINFLLNMRDIDLKIHLIEPYVQRGGQ